MSQRGMKWVFRLDSDPTRYPTASLKGMARYLTSAQLLLFLYSGQLTCVDRYIKFYRDRQVFLLQKPFLGGRMRIVAIQKRQATSAPQMPTPTSHYFLKMISPQYPSFYVTARVVSMVPILVDVDAFAPHFRPPSINAPPPPTVSHRVSVLLIISRTRLICTIQHLALRRWV
jgi:hypothetical protein